MVKPGQYVFSPYITMQNLALLQLEETVCQIVNETLQSILNVLINVSGFDQEYIFISVLGFLDLK